MKIVLPGNVLHDHSSGKWELQTRRFQVVHCLLCSKFEFKNVLRISKQAYIHAGKEISEAKLTCKCFTSMQEIS